MGQGSTYTVQTISLLDLLDQHGAPREIDFLSIDTEGSEIPIIESCPEAFLAAKVIYLEYHAEEDRRRIDGLLGDSHVLTAGRVHYPHRGEFAYVRKDAFLSDRRAWSRRH